MKEARNPTSSHKEAAGLLQESLHALSKVLFHQQAFKSNHLLLWKSDTPQTWGVSRLALQTDYSRGLTPPPKKQINLHDFSTEVGGMLLL